MTQPRLILYPQSLLDAPVNALNTQQALMEIGFITKAFKSNSFYAGDNFIDLIVFLGCSPDIQISPDENKAFCSVHFSDIKPHSRYLGHCDSISPRCPVCKSSAKNWKNTDNWQIPTSQYICNTCHTASALSDLKWKQQGGYGRFSISINNIHPHEAVPAEKILQALSDVTQFKWTYLYANNETVL